MPLVKKGVKSFKSKDMSCHNNYDKYSVSEEIEFFLNFWRKKEKKNWNLKDKRGQENFFATRTIYVGDKMINFISFTSEYDRELLDYTSYPGTMYCVLELFYERKNESIADIVVTLPNQTCALNITLYVSD